MRRTRSSSGTCGSPTRSSSTCALGFARALRAHGVERGDRVVVFTDNRLTASSRSSERCSQGASSSWSTRRPRRTSSRYILEDSGAAFVVTEGRIAAVASRCARERVERQGCADLRRTTRRARRHGRLRDARRRPPSPQLVSPATIPLDLAALIYTSGSTGNPKGVMMTHQNMVFAAGASRSTCACGRDDRILDVVPLAFDYGLYQLLMSVHIGGDARARALVRVSRRRRSSACEEEEVTVFPGVPTIYATLVSMHERTPLRLSDGRARHEHRGRASADASTARCARSSRTRSSSACTASPSASG